MKRVVVCAAIKDGDLILCGARHFDRVMCSQIDAIREPHPTFVVCPADAVQGFIDQYGEFMTREQALKVAIAASQKIDFDRNGSKTELYSEGLY